MRETVQQLGSLGIAAAGLAENRRLVEVNDCLARLLELSPHEGIGVDFGTVLAEKAAEHAAVGLSTLYRFGRSGTSWFRFDLKSIDGGFVGILTDVEQGYEPQEEVRRYSATRDQLLIDAKIGAWRYDPDDELYYFSTEISLGHSGAPTGVPVPLLQRLQHPDDIAKDSEIRERITREGGTANAEIRYRDAEGTWAHLNVHYRAGRQLASGRFEMFGISQNVTAIAVARDEANRASREADYANRAKTQFLANMSHELRTPLNAILGFSEVIERQMFGRIGDKYIEYARDIHRSGEHLLALVNDVLDLAKLEAGKLELRECDIAVGELVNDCVMLVRGNAEAGKIRLSVHLEERVQHVRADLRAVKQVLLNFLSNAIKFTPEGGSVLVRTSLDPSGRFCLTVKDSGIGMTEAGIQVALSPFGQIDSPLSRKHQGTGLGLPICRSLLELHGGDIVIESEPKVGTTLIARFPAGRVLASQAA